MTNLINLTQLRETVETGLGPHGISPVVQADDLLAFIDLAEAAHELLDFAREADQSLHAEFSIGDDYVEDPSITKTQAALAHFTTE